VRTQIKEKQERYASGVCLAYLLFLVVLCALYVALSHHLIGVGTFLGAIYVAMALLLLIKVIAYFMAKKAESDF
jgi:hypothetical protein